MKSLVKKPLALWLIRLLKNLIYKGRYIRQRLRIVYMVLVKNSTFGKFDVIHDEVKMRNCKLGSYNTIYPGAQLEDTILGDFSYVALRSILNRVTIGKFSCIGPEVMAGPGTHPSRDFTSTHPAFYSTQHQVPITFVARAYFIEKRSITIGNDVWIGARAIILDGVTIGDGAIVGAGAVVTGDVPDYAVVVGVPAKVVRYRFDEAQIDYLKKFKWWDRDIGWLKEHVVDFHDVQDFIRSTHQTDTY